MTRGLGKGLNSLIPEIYDENFDSNGAQSLEDILNEKSDEDIAEKESSEDIVVEETEKDDNNEPDVDEVNDNDEKDNDESNETSDKKIQEKDDEDTSSSKDVSGDKGTEEGLSDSQDVKKQENVAEVLDIVDKNPRITLWSSRSAAVFRYLRKTEPEFSISREASILIDEAVSKKYPDIWDLFEDLK